MKELIKLGNDILINPKINSFSLFTHGIVGYTDERITLIQSMGFYLDFVEVVIFQNNTGAEQRTEYKFRKQVV